MINREGDCPADQEVWNDTLLSELMQRNGIACQNKPSKKTTKKPITNISFVQISRISILYHDVTKDVRIAQNMTGHPDAVIRH